MKELLFKLGIAIVIILGFVGYRSYLVSSYDREIRDLQLRLAESVEPVDVRFIHDTVKVFEQKVVEVDRTDYKQHLADRDEIKALGLRVSELEHENRMLYALRDTVYLTPSDDSLMIYSDEWSTFRYDRSLCQLEWEVRDSLTTYVSVDYKHHFLWWRWGKKGYHVTHVNYNPHSTLRYSKYIKIR